MMEGIHLLNEQPAAIDDRPSKKLEKDIWSGKAGSGNGEAGMIEKIPASMMTNMTTDAPFPIPRLVKVALQTGIEWAVLAQLLLGLDR
jgi:hypothetical protein